MKAVLFALLVAVSAVALAQSAEDRLFRAIDDDKQLVAEGIVARSGLRLDARNGDNETALHRAIEKGFRPLSEMLVKAGAPVTARSKNGETPLHYAAAYGDEEMIQAMLLAGADREAPNTHGETPLNYAGRHHRPRSIRDLMK